MGIIEVNEAMQAAARRKYETGRIQWVAHDTNNAANPCFAQLLKVRGNEGYGMYWQLVELVADTETHTIPREGEEGYKRLMLGLGFESAAAFEDFISTLQELEIVTGGDDEARRLPVVDRAAEKLAAKRYSASKGGRTTAARRKQASGY